MNPTLLLEIGTEELPPKALKPLSRFLCETVAGGLRESGMAVGRAHAYATPRRLALTIEDVAHQTPDTTQEREGPTVANAFDTDGRPTKAAEGFARACGVAIADLETKQTDKGEKLVYSGTQPGRSLADLLPGVVDSALKRLPIPKRMRWGDAEAAFVRPVHWVVALHGDRVQPMTLFGCRAGRRTYGHRFHHPEAIELADAEAYAEHLHTPGWVIADFATRRSEIHRQVAVAAESGEPILDDELLDEVTALVEWPVALAGKFEERFLALPREAIIAVLEGHQRYFPVAGDDGRLLARFITVANIESKDPAQVIAGNERVIRPRLADALFFWEQDRTRGLDAYAAELGRVSFQKQLGSLADKTRRIEQLAVWLAQETGLHSTAAGRAATLCKADLLTEMVGEFPELQGIMGRYYAQAAGEDPAVAEAIGEHYAPTAAGGEIPATDAGRLLALADKLDTLAGIFALGRRPSGDKDPFALRRAALGVLRIVIEAGLELDLKQAITQALAIQPIDTPADTGTELLTFHVERLRAYYADRGIGPELFEAVAANGLRSPLDFDRRLHAVREFLSDPAARELSGAHKRVRNILKNQKDGGQVDRGLLSEEAESELFQVLLDTRALVDRLAQDGDYAQALHELARLQGPVDRFFDKVMVMSEDAATRDNRLALLAGLDATCRSVADISRLPS